MDDLTKAKAILTKLEDKIKDVSAELAIHKSASIYVEGVGRVVMQVMK